ncbi:MAG: hypothetical protein ACRDTH_26770 [Pseudonocardiaceae bacterium]
MARDEATAQPDIEQQLVTELAALVLEQIAPEELGVLDDTAQEYFADPQATMDPRRRDEPLGFGIDIALLGPYVLAIATPVITYLGSLVAQEVQEATKPLVADLVRRLFRRPSSDAAPITASASSGLVLTPEQGRWIRDTTHERALALGVPDAQAGVLADAVVGGLLVTRN